jgi:thioredoxin reductase (NADPH)
LSQVYKVIIIGSGPAGFTAALYASRANLEPIIFEGQQPGGQLTITTDVENYPGFPKGIMGPEMMELFREQAHRFGAKSIYKSITKVDFSKRPFKLTDEEGAEYLSETVIIATGASARLLGLPKEKELMGYGVSACATCDGFFFKGKKIMVVGGGDTAMEEANFLTRFATEVTIVHRREELRASKIMQERAFKNEKIKFLWNSEIVDVIGDPASRVKGVKIKHTRTGEVTEMPTEGLFIAIGHRPNTDIFKGVLDMDENGYLITKDKSTKTNIPGVFACGDAQDHYYRQAVTAAGSGCMAAIDAERFLVH